MTTLIRPKCESRADSPTEDTLSCGHHKERATLVPEREEAQPGQESPAPLDYFGMLSEELRMRVLRFACSLKALPTLRLSGRWLLGLLALVGLRRRR